MSGSTNYRGTLWTMRRNWWIAIGLVSLIAGWFMYAWLTFPSDRTPKGAYLRVVMAVNRGDPAAFFAYIETAAQHACYTIRDYRRQSVERINKSYPEPEHSQTLTAYQDLAAAADGADVFAIYARQKGWLGRLRRDLSGVAQVEVSGDRATVQTARGTRYPFRGLTLFTATLSAEAERAARDAAMVEQAAADYERDRQRSAVNAQAP
jgi:hypothetical protein